MKEKEFRKLIREEIKNLLNENLNAIISKQEKENIILQIYQWIIKGDMKKAVTAMQNDPTLLKLANNVEALKNELLKRMAQDDKMLELISQSINRLKAQKGIK
jgi:hypothetical protein